MAAADVHWDVNGGILEIFGDASVATNDLVTITVTSDQKYIVVKVQGQADWNGQAEGAEPADCKGIDFSGEGGDDLLDMTAVNSTNGFQAANLDGKINVGGQLGRDSITGSDFADDISGGDDATLTDRLIGNGGNDTIAGGAGPDHIEGGDGADSILAGDGNDTMYGGGHNDSLRGGPGDDNMYGSWGCDWFYGGAGSGDVGLGEYGDDTFDSLVESITGGTGKDAIPGQTDPDDFDGCGDPNAGGFMSTLAEPSSEFEYLRNAFFFQLGDRRYAVLEDAVDDCGCHSYHRDAVFETLASASRASRARLLGRLSLSDVDRAELLMILEIAANRRP